MAWTTGTSADWQDLLDDVRAFAVANGFTTNEYNTSVGGDSNVDEWIATGEGGGSDAIVIGIRTFYDVSADARNWELTGATGYNSGGTTWDERLPGASFGRFDGAGDTIYGSYTPLQNASISYWLSVTGRRIVLVAKCGTTFEHAILGWGDPQGTSAEYSYPILVSGSTPVPDTRYSSTRVAHSGPADPQGYLTGALKNGPLQVRDPGGTWRNVRNATEGTGNSRTNSRSRVVFPAGKPSIQSSILPDQADRWAVVSSAVLSFSDVVPQDGVPGTVAVSLRKTPSSGGDQSVLFPATVIFAPDANEHLIPLELPDIFWVSAAAGPTDAGLNSEDTITIGGDTYHVFQSANRTDEFAFFAVREG